MENLERRWMQMDADKRGQTVYVEVAKRINQFLCLYFLHQTLNSIHIHLRSYSNQNLTVQ